MAEDASGSTEETGGGGADPVALGAAMGRASPTVDAALVAYLEEQRHHLKAQFAPAMRQLRLGVWEKRLGVFLRLATLGVGLAAAGGIGFLTWSAAHSSDLIVDSFSVPPDLAQKGISGQVLAGQLVDRLVEMQGQTTSFRAPQTYSSNFGESIKLEIPETGISFGELDRVLRERLGDNKHISGDLVRTASGLKLSVRVSGDGSDSTEGAEADLDALVKQMAEAIYGRTQPFRYSTYVWVTGRTDQANRLFQSLVKSGSPSERSWAYISLGATSVDAEGSSASDEAIAINASQERRATELDPGNALAWFALGHTEDLLGYSENSLFAFRQSLAAISGRGAGLIRPDAVAVFRDMLQSRIDALLGRFDAAAQGQDEFGQSGKTGMTVGVSAEQAMFQAFGHRADAALATLAQPVPDSMVRAELGARYSRRARILVAQSRGDWSGVLRAAATGSPELLRRKGHFAYEDSSVAMALAGLGRFAEAEARIRDAPADCYPCLIGRAEVARMQGQDSRADAWFARAEAIGPSLPFAAQEWGQALLARGDAAGAIAKFKLSNAKGPHFADPLEGWGEALMAQNRSDLALAKFAQANALAPNWGRLHLKWGEALLYAGKKAEAAKQFATAATLDLTPSEKIALTKVPHG
jgi:tetratricopeptide (TPR) repeat protein